MKNQQLPALYTERCFFYTASSDRVSCIRLVWDSKTGLKLLLGHLLLHWLSGWRFYAVLAGVGAGWCAVAATALNCPAGPTPPLLPLPHIVLTQGNPPLWDSFLVLFNHTITEYFRPCCCIHHFKPVLGWAQVTLLILKNMFLKISRNSLKSAVCFFPHFWHSNSIYYFFFFWTILVKVDVCLRFLLEFLHPTNDTSNETTTGHISNVTDNQLFLYLVMCRSGPI